MGESLGEPRAPQGESGKNAPPATYLNRVALTDPVGAVEQAWKQVRESVKRPTRAAGLDPNSMRGALERVNALTGRDEIDPAIISSINQLRRLYYEVKRNRNLAVTPADAAVYVATSQALCDDLDRVITPSVQQRSTATIATAADRSGPQAAV